MQAHGDVLMSLSIALNQLEHCSIKHKEPCVVCLFTPQQFQLLCIFCVWKFGCAFERMKLTFFSAEIIYDGYSWWHDDALVSDRTRL